VTLWVVDLRYPADQNCIASPTLQIIPPSTGGMYFHSPSLVLICKPATFWLQSRVKDPKSVWARDQLLLTKASCAAERGR